MLQVIISDLDNYTFAPSTTCKFLIIIYFRIFLDTLLVNKVFIFYISWLIGNNLFGEYFRIYNFLFKICIPGAYLEACQTSETRSVYYHFNNIRFLIENYYYILIYCWSAHLIILGLVILLVLIQCLHMSSFRVSFLQILHRLFNSTYICTSGRSYLWVDF